ncbi:MAG TPA: VOC family protein [Streptosporangiaceae bacterium]|jgi:hypothetical protein
MVFWQLTINANDPALLARFWGQALGYQPVPPATPDTTWHTHYRARLGEAAAFGDRLFDPAGLRPPIWFQEVPEAKAGKNRLHLDLAVDARFGSLRWDANRGSTVGPGGDCSRWVATSRPARLA